jgi:hypothetical protein
MPRYTPYGPGDDATWPAYDGDPNDPRGPGICDDEPLDDEDDDTPAAGWPFPRHNGRPVPPPPAGARGYVPPPPPRYPTDEPAPF